MPKVSVNIPVYNGEKTIEAAIKSILAQTWTDFELLIVNDCSKDATAILINQFSDPRIRVIHHEQNQGISRTRNTLLSHSSGKYIAVLDADDLAKPDRLQKQLDLLEKHPELDGVFSWTEQFSGTEPDQQCPKYAPKFTKDQMREVILFENPLIHSAGFLKKEIMGEGYRVDLGCAEDYAKWLELIFGQKQFAIIQEPLTYSWVHTPTHYSREKMKRFVQELQLGYFEKALNRPMTEEEQKAQWSLYETSEISPETQTEAIQILLSAKKWIQTLEASKNISLKLDHDLWIKFAKMKYYGLCMHLLPILKMRVLAYSTQLNLEQQSKLLIKSFGHY